MRRLVLGIMGFYGIVLLVVWLLVRATGDQWWIGTILLFGPRWFLLLPLAVFIPVTVVWRPRLTPLWLVHGILILFPICDLHLGWQPYLADKQPNRSSSSVDTNHNGSDFVFMTCNIGGGDLNESKLASLLREQNVDALAIQECPNGFAEKFFQAMGWEYRQWKHLAIGTRHRIDSLKMLVENEAQYGAAVAMSIVIQNASQEPQPSPSHDRGESNPQLDNSVDAIKENTTTIVCVHLPTPRPGLEDIYRHGWGGIKTLNQVNEMRSKITRETRRSIESLETSDAPLLIGGDFNTPRESIFFAAHWRRWKNAFDEMGSGFGWTKWTKSFGVRIDHVLHDQHWKVLEAKVGPSLGGDHRPVMVRLARKP